MSADEKSRNYIHVAREEQAKYMNALLQQNEKLRGQVATLESDYRRLENLQTSTAEELDGLRVKLDGVEQENRRYMEEHHQIETHNSNLANLYVASYQLHSSVDRDAVLQTIQEIVINLIGSEEVAIFERGASNDFNLVSAFGIESSKLLKFRLGDGPIGRTLAAGETFVNSHARGGENQLTACVPLKINDTIVGGILIFSLLEHKRELAPVDHELLELLAVHASTSLYCATLHGQVNVAVGA